MAAAKKATSGNGKQYDETNQIAIFKAKDATEANRKPQLWGKMNVDGVDYKVSLWARTSKAGNKFYSGQIQRADESPAATNGKKAAAADDDIPF